MSSTAASYLLGHSDLEIQRLQIQARVLEDVTRRLIRECGIGPGMHVLDIGCGVGDVSMLLADAVGPYGSVVAIDREKKAIDAARHRAATLGYERIRFEIHSDEDLPSDVAFDAAIGRYVLIHQRDPVGLVRRAASVVRPGGIVAFQEPVFQIKGTALPKIDLYNYVRDCNMAAVCALFPSPDVGGRLMSCFEEAGLPSPELLCESIVGGPDSPVMPWIALSHVALLPHIERLGLARELGGDPATLSERLVEAASDVRAQIVSMPQTCAWSRRPAAASRSDH